MAMMNIGENDDPEYRYKMPRLIAKIEGKGNGIKTVLVNCVAISKALRRPPEQVCKFFGAHLGAQTKFIAPKKDVDAKAIVNGAFETGMLQDCLQKEYIPRFVLCPGCGLPETDLSVVGSKKAGFKVMHTCQACGYVGEADTKHKLCTFIIADAKKQAMGDTTAKKQRKKGGGQNLVKLYKKLLKKKEKGEKLTKEEKKQYKECKKAKKAAKKEKKAAKKAKKAARKARKAAEAAAAEAEGSADSDSDSSDDDGTTEAARIAAAKAAAAAAPEEMPDGSTVATLANLTVDDSAAIETAVDRMRDFAADGAPSADELLYKVKALQVNSGFKAADCVPIFVFGVLTGAGMKHVKPQAAYPAHGAVLKALVGEDGDKQRALLACVEESLGVRDAAMLAATPLALKALYDLDVLDEDVVLAWYTADAGDAAGGLGGAARSAVTADVRAKLRAKAKPFCEWLQSADGDDSESGSESESSSDEE